MSKNRSVIVFGGSGFLGSHVADSLSDDGYQVTIFDKRKSPYLREDQEMIVGDILDDDILDSAISGNDIVYNFAGISDIDECHKYPIETLQYNVLGNAKILSFAKKNNIKKFLFASSAYVYSSSGSFYRISKQSSELFIESFSESFGIDFSILRYGSLYGERSNSLNSIHRLIKSAILNRKITYYGDGNEMREFIHVKDAANLSVEALDSKYNNQILMLTGTKSIKYIDLLNMINEILNDKIKIEMFPKKSKNHYRMTPYSYNPKTAKKLISNPHIDLGQGLLNQIDLLHKSIHSDKID